MCLASSVYAGGYRVALQGQKAQGMGHTGVAMADSSEVVFFNPAGMSFLEADIDMTAGLTLIDSEAIYQNELTNASAKTDNPVGTPISFYLARKYDETISYGIGVYTPYGNAVEWEKDWVGSHLVNEIELHAIFIQPTISYKFSDKYSVGFGPTYVIGSVEFNRNLSTSLVDANGDRANVTIDDSVDAWGYNIGFLARPTNKFSVGISYRSQIELEARNGSADFENIPSSMQSAFFDTTFNADLVLPAELTIGIAYNISSDTVFALDINHTYWSAYESLDVQFDNAAGLSSNPRNYKDANIYRVGIQHNMNNKLTVRGGLYIDQSPIRDGYFTPETPRNDSLGLTLGATYKMAEENVEVDFSFLSLRFKEFEGSYDHYDQSGTTISFGGDYKSSVIAIGLGLNYKF